MPIRRPPLIVAIVLAALPASALAGPPTLEEVTVEETRPRDLPTAETPDADDLAARRAATRDAAEILRGLPGVSTWGAGGVSSLPAIRGLADDRLRVQVDGMDLVSTCANHMNPPLSYLAPAQVSAVKVYAGVVPVSVGGDSIGGAIAFETAPPRFAREGVATGGEIGVNGASNGDALGVDVAFTVAGEALNFAYTGSTARADNHRAGGDFKTFTGNGREGGSLPRDEVGSSGYETRNQQASLAWRAGDQLFEARIGAQDMPFQGFPNQRMDLTDNRQRRYQLRWQGSFGRLAIDGRLWHESVEHAMDFGDDKRFWYGMASMPPGVMGVGRPCSPVSPTCAAGMPMIAESRTNAVRVAADWTLSPTDVLRLGGEMHAYRLDDYWPPSGGNMFPGAFANINDGERDRTAVFLEWEGGAETGWRHLVGVRVEDVDTDTGEVRGYDVDPAPPGSFMMTAADAAAFNARERARSDTHLDLAASVRRVFDERVEIELGAFQRSRSPNLYERYAWSTWEMAAIMNNTIGDGNGYVGNPDLDPEVARGIAASLTWHAPGKDWGLRASPYYTRVDDYIDAVRITNRSAAFNVLRHANVDARLSGIDLSGWSAPIESGTGTFTVRGTASLTDGGNRESGESLYNIMPLNARLTVEHRAGAWRNALEVVGVARKDDLSGVRNEVATHGYGLLNLRLGWSAGALRVDFGVENAFDRLYRLPQGGAYVGQGTTMMINAVPWGIAVPGRGRSYFAGVRWAF